MKLLLTDGVKEVIGMEYRNVDGFNVDIKLGTKIAVKEVRVRRGILLLTNENCIVLGGICKQLELKRQEFLESIPNPGWVVDKNRFKMKKGQKYIFVY